jgi:Membrane MotB of proton-channel complex MotA/MotB
MDKARPIIILEKKGAHAGHHGGAWKVAYADFVTAMMARFIVLWLLNSSKQVQEAVGGYFKDPTGTAKKVGSNMQGAGENFVLTRDNMPRLKEQLQNAMRQMADFEKLKSHIDMTVTAEGLRIELSESASGTFSTAAVPSSIPMARNCSSPLLQSSAAFPTSYPWRATPIRSLMPHRPPTAIGNSPRTAPMPHAASCSPMECAPIRSLKFAASPTNAFGNQTPLSTLSIGASPSSFSTSPRTPTKVSQRRNRRLIRNRKAPGRIHARAKDPRTDSNCIIPF